jgi:hypothetical protein
MWSVLDPTIAAPTAWVYYISDGKNPLPKSGALRCVHTH